MVTLFFFPFFFGGGGGGKGGPTALDKILLSPLVKNCTKIPLYEAIEKNS